jgi:hypothetical protein
MMRRDSLQSLAARSPSPAARGQSRLAALHSIAARPPSPAARGPSRLAALQAVAARPPSPGMQRGMPRPLVQSPSWGSMSPTGWGAVSPPGSRPLSPGFDASRRGSQQGFQQDWAPGPPHVQLAALPPRPPSPAARPQLPVRPPSPAVRTQLQLPARPSSPAPAVRSQLQLSRPASVEPGSAPQGLAAIRTQLRAQAPAMPPPVQQQQERSWEIRAPAPSTQEHQWQPPARQQRPLSPGFAPAAPPQAGLERWEPAPPPARRQPSPGPPAQPPPQPQLQFRPSAPDPAWQQQRAARDASPNLYAQQPPAPEPQPQPPPPAAVLSPRPARTNLRLAAASRSLSLSLQQDEAAVGGAAPAAGADEQPLPERPALQNPLSLAARRARMLEELARAAPGAQPRRDEASHDD